MPHEGGERVPVNARRPARHLAQRLEFRPEKEHPVESPPVQRLDAETVPGKNEFARLPIEEGECEHSDQSLDRARCAPLRAGLKDHLGVGRAPRYSAGCDEVGRDFAVRIHLAVVDDHEPAA